MPVRSNPTGASIAPSRALLLLLIVLAFAFQGSRGLWEPDEGFYGAAAAEMFDRGEWLVPTLEGRPFLDKPPSSTGAASSGCTCSGATSGA